MISPHKLGLPRRFRHWRPQQPEALDRILRATRRFVPQNAPTGFGKSLIYMAAALSFPKTTILTATKALQDQLMRDFRKTGLKNVSGMQNYDCKLEPGTTVESGPCHFGIRCDFKSDGCSFFDGLRAARESDLRLTNYAFYLARDEEVGIGESELLVCDEAHAALDEVTARQTLALSGRVLHTLRRHGCNAPPLDEPDRRSPEWEDWVGSADLAAHRVAMDYTGSRRTYYRRLRQQLKTFREATSKKWVLGCDHHGGFSWSPLWPDMNALWRNAETVLLVSATLTPKHLDLFGIKEGDREELSSYRSPFPRARRPIYYLPTVRVTWRSTPEELAYWVQRMDQIIGKRLDRKGLIHTVSYERARYIYEHSKYRRHMLIHESGQSRQAVEAFRSMPAPAILLSPAVSTGVDFPYEHCLYQIIGKIPFPDTRHPLLAARCKDDPDYHSHLAADEMVQMTGRAMRSADDYCETFLIDDQARWFVWKGKGAGLFPEWWSEAFTQKDVIPTPLSLDDVRNP